MAKSLWALFGAAFLAVVVNVGLFLWADALTVAVKYSMLTDVLVVLVLVPVYQWFSIGEGLNVNDLPVAVKNGMKAAAPMAVFLGLVTFALLHILGDGLIAARMAEVAANLDGHQVVGAERDKAYASAQFIYSPLFHSTFVLLSTAMTGFMVSIGSSLLMRR